LEMTKNPEVRFAKSIDNYIFRWMATKFLSHEAQYRAGVNMREPAETGESGSGTRDSAVGIGNVGAGFLGAPKLGTSEGGSRPAAKVTVGPAAEPEIRRGGPSGPPEARPRTSEFAAMRNQEDAPPCSTCGSIMIRSGSCYKCANCGTTSGCA